MPSNDPYSLQPYTLLDAVNIIMRAIGAGAVQTLDYITKSTDAEDALKSLHDWSMQVQQDGWQWNTDEDLVIDPAPADDMLIPGRIQLPSDTLKVDTVGISAPLDLVQRGLYLWDKKNHTFNIGKSVHLDLVHAIDFEDLPQAVRNYITIKAAQQFAGPKLNSGATNQFTKEAMQEAYIKLLNAEDESDDRTMYDRNRRMQLRARHRQG